jgi:hypothetical protein
MLLWLARHRARDAVKEQIRAQGKRISDYYPRELAVMAEELVPQELELMAKALAPQP